MLSYVYWIAIDDHHDLKTFFHPSHDVEGQVNESCSATFDASLIVAGGHHDLDDEAVWPMTMSET